MTMTYQLNVWNLYHLEVGNDSLFIFRQIAKPN